MRNVRILLLIAPLFLGSCDKEPSPAASTRTLHLADSVTIFYYRNWQGTGQPHMKHFAFSDFPDTLVWSEGSTFSRENWLYMRWPDPSATENEWQFAFPGVREFGQLAAADSYTFIGASNSDRGPWVYPMQRWTAQAVLADFDDASTGIILARRLANPYPVLCLKVANSDVLPESADSLNYYQRWTFECRTYD